MSNELWKPATVDKLIEAHKKLLLLAGEYKRVTGEIQNILKSTDLDSPSYLPSRKYRTDNWLEVESDEQLKRLNASAWLALLKVAGITELLTEGKKKELRESYCDEPPNFDAEQIAIFAHNIKNIYANSIDQTVKDVYGKLIGCDYNASDWRNRKADNLQGIKKQFRIAGGGISCDRWGNYTYYRSEYARAFDFEDLYTVCKLLDGKSRHDYSDTFWTCIGKTKDFRETGETETHWFKVKAFKNGNCFVTWTRLDILKEFNKIGGGGQLPDVQSKKYKAEHWER